MDNLKDFDILIVGGGHAGIEAAHMAAQFPLKIAIVTLPGVGLASAPCNPSVGGVGKGQVVREIDALGGLMSKLADEAGIQYRVLNESKGHALRSTRVQIDKELYSQVATQEIKNNTKIALIEGQVNSIQALNLENNGKFDYKYQVQVVAVGGSWSYRTKRLIITTGTFLNAKLHCGQEVKEGGRIGAQKSSGLAELFAAVKVNQRRFKTGTPPRIIKKSIDFTKLLEQPSDETVGNFHWRNFELPRKVKQLSCYLTHTNEKTLSIVRLNKEKSPMYNGQITATGARYCPSLEDKAYRYENKSVHHVFLEPEGINLDTYYPSGISTSLPKEVQSEFLATIEGLESAEIAHFGYAVEYDVIDTTQLDFTLQYRDIPGLYFAGQVNGTSGYEEAAGQGLIAGLNAALSLLEISPIILSRQDSYIGVMIEDLVTQKRDEPYRLFSARCENRLEMREDNTFSRMYHYRKKMQLNDPIDHYHELRLSQLKLLSQLVEKQLPGDEDTIQAKLKNPKVDPVELLIKILNSAAIHFAPDIISEVAIQSKYDGYITKQKTDFKKLDRPKINTLNIDLILKSENISFECKHRIAQFRPDTFTQLQKIPGLRPVTLAIIAANRI